jgi:SAM-dependent methyltransferase
MGALGSLLRLTTSYQRACFLSAAGRSGLLRALARGSASLDQIAGELGVALTDREALAEWLEVGVRVRVLGRSDDRSYGLRGPLARALAGEANDDMLALLTETVDLHRTLLLETPLRLRQGRGFTLADQVGDLIARSSRVLEPAVREAIEEVIPRKGALRLLEIGCGSGIYLRYAAQRNPHLTAVGLELQRDVAALASRNLRMWGLSARATIEVGDIIERAPERSFDVATLHNNIYYFPTDGRTKLLAHVRSFLRPGGRLLLTTGCRGGSAGMTVLSLWGAVTRGCGPLPEPEELATQLRQAGFRSVTSRNLLAPFERFYAFVGVA